MSDNSESVTRPMFPQPILIVCSNGRLVSPTFTMVAKAESVDVLLPEESLRPVRDASPSPLLGAQYLVLRLAQDFPDLVLAMSAVAEEPTGFAEFPWGTLRKGADPICGDPLLRSRGADELNCMERAPQIGEHHWNKRRSFKSRS